MTTNTSHATRHAPTVANIVDSIKFATPLAWTKTGTSQHAVSMDYILSVGKNQENGRSVIWAIVENAPAGGRQSRKEDFTNLRAAKAWAITEALRRFVARAAKYSDRHGDDIDY